MTELERMQKFYEVNMARLEGRIAGLKQARRMKGIDFDLSVKIDKAINFHRQNLEAVNASLSELIAKRFKEQS